MAAHDTWLEGVSSKEAIRAARQAKEKAESLAAQQNQEDKSRSECLKALVETGLVRRGETVMDALRRLGNEKRRLGGNARKTARPNKKKAAQEGDAMDVDSAAAATTAATSPEAEALNRVTAQIDEISTLASTLLGPHGETNIYEESWDSIVKTLRLEGEVPRGWEPKLPNDDSTTEDAATVPESTSTSVVNRPLISRPTRTEQQSRPTPSAPQSDARYFYRWLPDSGAPADQLGRAYGPFSHTEMVSWVDGHYFGPNGKNIQVRRSSEEDESAWRSWEVARAA
jgi:CD2 antigen cytoplasmic tail-binding protein 2